MDLVSFIKGAYKCLNPIDTNNIIPMKYSSQLQIKMVNWLLNNSGKKKNGAKSYSGENSSGVVDLSQDNKREKNSTVNVEPRLPAKEECIIPKSNFEKVSERVLPRKSNTPYLRQTTHSNLKPSRAKKQYGLFRNLSRHRTTHIPKLLLFIFMMGNLPGIDPSELSQTICKYLDYKNECSQKLENDSKYLDPDKIYCPGEFGSYICWPYTEAGEVVQVPCPGYYEENNDSLAAIRLCRDNGEWHKRWDEAEQKFVEWTHKEDCYNFDNVTQDPGGDMVILHNFQVMYSVGFGLSITCLVVALLLLGFFKKLHCTRNYIHMNLMISFILRYVAILVKDGVLTSHYKLDSIQDPTGSGFDLSNLDEYCDKYFPQTPGIHHLTQCRLVIILTHYIITANYFWLLVEGLYLQMLLVFVMSENKYLAGFMAFGWGAPWISVIIWTGLRLKFENSGCWELNDELHIWWTIRAPIIISIMINFLIFVNIVRLIVSKLKANNMARSDIKLRLAKSTLALIPLLGIHYIVFLALTDEVTTDNPTGLHMRLAFEMFLTSIQGALVAVLYCFLNGEVQAEVRKAWRDWKIRKHLPKGPRKGSTSNSATHSTQVTFFSRHSTAGGDANTQDTMMHQSPNSVRLDMDSKKNSIIARSSFNSNDIKLKHELTNGNGIVMDAKKDKVCYNNKFSKNNNGDSCSSDRVHAEKSQKEEINGNIECQDSTPLMQENSV